MILFILLSVLSGAFASPGVQEQAHRQPQPPWFVVFEERGASGDLAQFMGAQIETIELWRQLHSDVPVFTWRSDNYNLYRVIPILSFASIDTLYEKMEQVEQLKKTATGNVRERPGSPSTVSATVMEWVPELSHHQAIEFSQNPGETYTKWMFFYLVSGHEEAAEEALGKFRDYYISKKLDYPWDTFRVLLGNNTPVIINMFRSESPAALQQQGNRIWNKHGQELGRLWEEVVQHTWKIENKSSWFNPSLSNVPVVITDEQVAGNP